MKSKVEASAALTPCPCMAVLPEYTQTEKRQSVRHKPEGKRRGNEVIKGREREEEKEKSYCTGEAREESTEGTRCGERCWDKVKCRRNKRTELLAVRNKRRRGGKKEERSGGD